MMIKPLLLAAALCGVAAQAQQVDPATEVARIEFPSDAENLSAAALDERLRGNKFTTSLPNGISWRMDYKASGYVFVDVSNGARDNGKWRTEDGKVCAEYRERFPSGCSEMRGGPEGTLYLKRNSTGEIVKLRKQ